jgi:hypothetical protein
VIWYILENISLSESKPDLGYSCTNFRDNASKESKRYI